MLMVICKLDQLENFLIKENKSLKRTGLVPYSSIIAVPNDQKLNQLTQ